MPFAIFYNTQDLPVIIEMVNRATLSSADKRIANACWNGGLSGYATAPVAPDEYRCVDTPMGRMCDDDCRIVVVNATVSGKVVTLTQFRDLLRRNGLGVFADDMEGAQGAVEPWPPV